MTRHDLSTIFFATLRTKSDKGRLFAVSSRSFALTVRQVSANNEFARNFFAVETSVGWTSPGFDDILSEAFYSLIVQYSYPDFTRFWVQVSEDTAQTFLRRFSTSQCETVSNFVEVFLTQ